MKDKSLFEKIVLFGSWAFAGVLLGFLMWSTIGYGWDFKNYLDCADQALHHGVDTIARSSWPYTYPPITFNLFRPFLWMSRVGATRLWIILKLANYGVMFWIWNRYFLRLSARDPLFILLMLLAFNGAFFYDIESGNISGFQHLLLWIGFAALIKRRPAVFTTAVVLAATIKFDVGVLLAMLLVDEDGPHWTCLFAAAAAFALWTGLNFWVYPQWSSSYVHLMTAMPTYARSVNNPSMLAFLSDFIERVGGLQTHIAAPARFEPAVYSVAVLAILGISALAWRKFKARGGTVDARWLIGFGCIIFGLITPRIPPYLYALMLLPSWWVLKEGGGLMSGSAPLLLLVFPQTNSSFPRPIGISFDLFNVYLPWMGLCVIWFLYIRLFWNDKPAPPWTAS